MDITIIVSYNVSIPQSIIISKNNHNKYRIQLNLIISNKS